MRAMIVGPSGSGKSTLLVSMILDIYRGAFERIFIWSPSVNLDSIWLPVKKYIKEGLKVDTDTESCWWDEFNVEDLERVIETQNTIIEYQKNQGMKKLFNIFVIFDEVSDNPALTRNNKLLNSLFCRGRHSGISTLVSLQKSSTVPPIIRVNRSHLFCYKVRNSKEIETLQDELSAIVRSDNLLESKKLIYKIYETATDEPHSFLYINLLQKDPSRIFMKHFSQYLKISIKSLNILYYMLFYDLPIDIKNIVLSYNLGDVRLLKIKINSIIKKYINKFKPVYKSYKSNQIF